ncbi:hypothetical protein [Enterococcus sp. BWB1-3]|uniref:hypothetical protein n=1 Tax=Enterococcus sp. BWB1-3 TaxID=2787713 RepID=UPI001F30AA87|nr:hypothetical protein [Enterococcus sp. BWB1-3]
MKTIILSVSLFVVSIFITQNTRNILTNQLTQTIHVTKENYVQIGKYSVTFFFDHFTCGYASLYD